MKLTVSLNLAGPRRQSDPHYSHVEAIGVRAERTLTDLVGEAGFDSLTVAEFDVIADRVRTEIGNLARAVEHELSLLERRVERRAAEKAAEQAATGVV